MRWMRWLVLLVLWVPRADAMVGTANETDLQAGAVGIVDPLTVAKGGTGVATITDRSVIIGRGTAAVEDAAPGNAGQVLRSTGAAANPAFGAVDLNDTDAITNTLPTGNGGTGQTAATDDATLIGNGSAFVISAIPSCSGATNALTYNTGTNALGCNSITSGIAPIVVMSSLGDVCQGASCGASNATVFITPGAVDATEGRAQTIAPLALTMNNLRCVSSVAPGSTEDYTITMRDGVCTGALSSSGNQTCVISNTNRSCSAATSSEAVSAGECFAWQVVGSNGAANAVVTCTAERTG